MGKNSSILTLPLIAVLALFFTFSLASCSKDKRPNPTAPIPKAKPAAAPLALAYDFKPREACEGYCDKFQKLEVCETVQSFETQEAFCAGLKDAPLNNFCARDERAALYKERCGDGFEETGLGGFTTQVADERIGSCSFSIPVSTSTEYCASLSNEETNVFCGWEQRRELFKQYSCAGDFSSLPEDTLTVTYPMVDLTNENIVSISEKSSIVKTMYRRSFTIPTRTSPAVLVFKDVVLREENCEVSGQARFGGSVVNTLTGSGSPTTKVLEMLANIENLSVNHEYQITVEVSNPGLCQDFEFAYTLEIQ